MAFFSVQAFSKGALPLCASALLLLSACAEMSSGRPTPGTAEPAPPDKVSLKPAKFTDLIDWAQDDLLAAKPALTRSCDRLTGQDDSRPVGPAGQGGKVSDWRAGCGAIEKASTAPALRQALETYFQPFEVSGRDGRQGLFTGYYEAELRGARRPGGAFQTPLYRRPEDLITVELADWRADWRGQRIAGDLEQFIVCQQVQVGVEVANSIRSVASTLGSGFLNILNFDLGMLKELSD